MNTLLFDYNTLHKNYGWNDIQRTMFTCRPCQLVTTIKLRIFIQSNMSYPQFCAIFVDELKSMDYPVRRICYRLLSKNELIKWSNWSKLLYLSSISKFGRNIIKVIAISLQLWIISYEKMGTPLNSQNIVGLWRIPSNISVFITSHRWSAYTITKVSISSFQLIYLFVCFFGNACECERKFNKN